MTDDGIEVALVHAGPALYATFLVNDVAFLGLAGNATSRAFLGAKGTPYAFFGDVILQ